MEKFRSKLADCLYAVQLGLWTSKLGIWVQLIRTVGLCGTVLVVRGLQRELLWKAARSFPLSDEDNVSQLQVGPAAHQGWDDQQWQ